MKKVCKVLLSLLLALMMLCGNLFSTNVLQSLNVAMASEAATEGETVITEPVTPQEEADPEPGPEPEPEPDPEPEPESELQSALTPEEEPETKEEAKGEEPAKQENPPVVEPVSEEPKPEAPAEQPPVTPAEQPPVEQPIVEQPTVQLTPIEQELLTYGGAYVEVEDNARAYESQNLNNWTATFDGGIVYLTACVIDAGAVQAVYALEDGSLASAWLSISRVELLNRDGVISDMKQQTEQELVYLDDARTLPLLPVTLTVKDVSDESTGEPAHEPPVAADAAALFTVVISLKDDPNLRVRQTPEQKSDALGYVDNGATVDVLAQIDDEWYYIRTADGLCGYVRIQYTAAEETPQEQPVPETTEPETTDEQDGETEPETEQPAESGDAPAEFVSFRARTIRGAVNLRNEPSTNGVLMRQLDRGAVMTVTAETTNDKGELWYSVTYRKADYYVLAELVEATDAPADEAEGDAADVEGEQGDETLPELELTVEEDAALTGEPTFVPGIPETVPEEYSLMDGEESMFLYPQDDGTPLYRMYGTYGELTGFFVCDSDGNITDYTALANDLFALMPETVPDEAEGFVELVPPEIPWFYTVVETPNNEVAPAASLLRFFISSAKAESTQRTVYKVTIEGVDHYRVYGTFNGQTGFFACDADGSNIITTAPVTDAPAFVTGVPETAPAYYTAVEGNASLFSLTYTDGANITTIYRLYLTTNGLDYDFYPCDENGYNVELAAPVNPAREAALTLSLTEAAQTFVTGANALNRDTLLLLAQAVLAARAANPVDAVALEAANNAIAAPMAGIDALNDAHTALTDNDKADLRVVAAYAKVSALWQEIAELLYPVGAPMNSGGVLTVTSKDYVATQTTYNMYDSEGKYFRISYTPPPATTSNNILIVRCPEYGVRFAAKPETNAQILSTVFTNDAHTEIAIVLVDGIGQGTPIAIDFRMERAALTQAQAIAWMDAGSVSTTIQAQAVTGTLSDTTVTVTQEDPVVIYCTMSPESVGAASITATHTYDVDVSGVAELMNTMLGNVGTYQAPSIAISSYWHRMVGSLRYQIPTVEHTNPLIEITGLKVYTPSDKLTLQGVAKEGGDGSRGSSLTPDMFDAQWDLWVVTGPSTDAGGEYYTVTPNTRWFNIGDDDAYTDQFYGMRFIWQLKNANDPPLPSTAAITDYQAADTVVLYRTPVVGSGTPAAATTAHTGPAVHVYTRSDDSTLFHAYVRNRREDLAEQAPISAGATYLSNSLSFTTNTNYLTGTGTDRTEHVPAYQGAVKQTYSFPEEIQPSRLTLSMLQAPNSLVLTYGTSLASARYKTADGIWHSATTAEVSAINAYYAAGTGAPSVAFTAASDTNRVTDLELNWSSLRTIKACYYSANEDYIYGNDPTSGTTYGYTYDVGVAIDFKVPATVPDGTKARVVYDLTMPDNSSNNHSLTNYIWYAINAKDCPTLYGEMAANPYSGYSIHSYLADGSTYNTENMGSVSLLIGAENSHIPFLTDPEIDFNVQFHADMSGTSAGSSRRLQMSNRITGITEEEGLAFLTGRMTVSKYLAGWTFTYDTNIRTGATYTVPVDATGDTVVELLDGGEYLRSLKLSYMGDFYIYNGYVGEPMPMLSNIGMRRLNTNPFTGAAINASENFIANIIALNAHAKWGNCADHDHRHDPAGDGQEMQVRSGSANSTVYAYRTYPQKWLNFSYKITIPRPGSTLDTVIDTMPQGGTSGFTAAFTWPAHSITPFGAGLENVFSAKREDYTSACVPWSGQEAVYVELTDNELMFDPTTTYLYGAQASGENVTYQIVTLGGRRFVKLQLVPGYIRTQTGAYQAGFYNGYAKLLNTSPSSCLTVAAGGISVGFKSLPGCTVGMHYPIGKIYLDFSKQLDDYDAPNDTAATNPSRAEYVFTNAVQDTLGLSSTHTSEAKLFEYDASQHSATPYQVEVVLQAALGADVVPGINGVYDWTTRRVSFFYTHQADLLEGLYTVTAPTNNDVYDFTSYISIPKAGVPRTYKDSEGNVVSKTSQYDMCLTGVPHVLSNSTQQGAGNIHYAYTYDANPSATSAYDETEPVSQADWKRVTGVRVIVDTMPRESAVNIVLPLAAAHKSRIGDVESYIGGTCTYRMGTATATPADGWLSLGTYLYTDYKVNAQPSLVFADIFNENGLQGITAATGSATEKSLEGIFVELLDTDGVTVIDSDTTDADGDFQLYSYKRDAGQIMRITLPTKATPNDPASADATWRLTKQSAAGTSANLRDSDFDRATNTLVLPQLLTSGFTNLSAGLVRLPEITVPDVTVNVGATVDVTATLAAYFGAALPTTSYNLTFSTAADPTIATVTDQTIALTGAERTGTTQVAGLKPGETTATVTTTNTLGDEVTVTFKITVTVPKIDIPVTKTWSDNNNALGARPDSIQLQLQRTSADVPLENVGVPITVTAPTGGGNSWTSTFSGVDQYDAHGDLYTYSVVEVTADNLKNYTPATGGDNAGLTVTNTLNTISLDGKKIWAENGAGFVRPDILTINLYRDDNTTTVFASQNLAKDEAVTEQDFTFPNLIKFKPDGTLYVYTVSEAVVPTNYTMTQSGNNITNAYSITSFTINKTWDFTGAPAAGRPTEVTVYLWRDDSTTTPYQTLTLTEAGGWTQTITIPALQQQNHTFRVTEEPVPGYQATYSDPTFTRDAGDNITGISYGVHNTFTVPKVTVSGTKTWLNVPATGVTVPSVQIRLWRNTPNPTATDTPLQTQTIASGSTSYSFTDLDRYDSTGAPYVYTITEAPVTGYDSAVGAPVVNTNTGNVTCNVTNTYNPAPVPVEAAIEKVVSGTGAPDETFSFVLTRDNPAYPMPADVITGNSKTITRVGTGNVSFGAINYTLPGTYTYTLTETAGTAEGYSYDGTIFTVTILVTDTLGVLTASTTFEKTPVGGTKVSAAALLFTNTYTMPVVNVPVSKIWDDNSDAAHVRPAFVRLQLQRTPAGGVAEDVGMPIVLTGTGNTWTYTFTNLPKYSNTHALYTYSVVEVAAASLNNYAAPVYGVDVDGNLTVTNTFASISVPLTKTWADNDDANNVRPDSIQVQLKRKTATGMLENVGTAVTVTPGAAVTDPWTHTFTDLPRYNAQGDEYTYSIEEIAADNLKNYQATTGGDNAGLTILNTLQTITLSGRKIWDERAQGFVRPANIQINVFRSDDMATRLTFVTVDGSENADPATATTWAYQIPGMLKYDAAGVEYTYVITEEVVPTNYNATISGMDVTNAFPANRAYQVTKVWDHTGAPTADRPTEIEVRLMRDGVQFGDSVTLNAGNRWTDEFTVPDADASGHIFTYEEVVPAHYSVVYGLIAKDDPNNPYHAAGTITNTYIMPKVTVSGTKTWANVPATGVTIPNVQVNLLRNGQKIADAVITSGETSYLFSDLDRYDADGNVYNYTVEELDLVGYDENVGTAVTDPVTGNVTIDLTNTYNPTPVFQDPPVQKLVTGADAPAENFTFVMEGSTGAPMPAGSTGQTKTVQAPAGLVEFGIIEFNMPGDYLYTIYETAGTTAGYTYDTKVYTMLVSVTDTMGVLSKDVSYSLNGTMGNYAGALFTNVYEKPLGDLVISKAVDGDPAPTGDTFTFTVTFGDGGTYSGVASGSTITLQAGQNRTINGIPQGVTYSVTETAKTNYTTPNATLSGTISDVPAAAAFVNTYTQPRGTLVISKTVTGDTAPATDEFTFTVTFSDGGTYAYTGSKTGNLASGGTVTLGHNASITFATIPQGVTYSVTETARTNYATPNATLTGTIGATTSTAAFVNTFTQPRGNLTVSKTVTGDTAPATDAFTFTVTFGDGGTHGGVASGSSFTMLAGESRTIIGIPQGVTYSVTETAKTNYTTPNATLSGTIGATTSTAAFVNTYTQPRGSFTLSKVVTGANAPATDEFAFTVTFSDGGTYAYTGSRSGNLASGGSVLLRHNESITFGAVPIGVTYTVVEAAKANYTPTPSTRTIMGTVAATPGVAAFSNAYDDPNAYGNLTVRKTVVGDLANRNHSFSFVVSFSAAGSYQYRKGNESGSISSGATLTLKHGESFTVYGLPEFASYTVTESNSGNYTVTSTGANGTISRYGNTAAFTNTYSSVPKTGDENNNLLLVLLMILFIGVFGGFLTIRLQNRKKSRR